jgi:hypothetical protein
MKTNRIVAGWLALAALAVFNLQPSAAHAQGTAFSYQGRLNDGGSPASGLYDFRFRLDADPLGNTILGTALTNAIPVTNGLFATTIDFGAGLFNGSNCWLEVDVRTNGNGSYTALTPLQAVTPTPYAIMANSASNLLGNLPATKLTGTVGNGQLANSAITVTAGTGLSGGGVVALGGSTTLNNSGVISVTGNADITAATVNGAVTLDDTATSANTANTIVKRDASGNFAAGTITAGGFSGNGANLTALNANNLSSGTVALTQLPSSVITNGASEVNITGSFTGNGGGLTNLNAQNIAGYGTWVTNYTTNYAFGLASTPAVGSGPRSVAAFTKMGGNVALVCANYNDNTLTVLTNNGSGLFSSNATYAVGSYPMSVAAFANMDGKLDLVCAIGGGLTVLTNNGSGLFGSNATYTVSDGPNCVIAADVNNDGKLDLISANNGNTLTVLTNNGNGGFGFSSTISTGLGYTPNCTCSLCAADVNHDGWADLVCANGLNNTLMVFTNNASGGFVFSATLAVGIGAWSVCAADVNGDGRLDLICADGTLTVLTNNGSGIFGSNTNYTVGSNPACVIAADVNGDGVMDLISANYGNSGLGNTLTVWTNSATASYSVTGGGGGGGSSPTGTNYILAYSTNLQAVVTANTFQDITNSVDAQLSGWTANAAATSFTSVQTGLYLVQYSAEATTTATFTNSVSVRAVVNGTEIAGSEAIAGTYTANMVVLLSKSFIASLNAGDILKFQLAGTSTTCRIVSITVAGTTSPSFSCTIIRLQ